MTVLRRLGALHPYTEINQLAASEWMRTFLAAGRANTTLTPDSPPRSRRALRTPQVHVRQDLAPTSTPRRSKNVAGSTFLNWQRCNHPTGKRNGFLNAKCNIFLPLGAEFGCGKLLFRLGLGKHFSIKFLTKRPCKHQLESVLNVGQRLGNSWVSKRG